MPNGAADNASWVIPATSASSQRASAMHRQRGIRHERRQEFHAHAAEPPERRHPRLQRDGNQNSGDGDEGVHSCPRITITSSKAAEIHGGCDFHVLIHAGLLD